MLLMRTATSQAGGAVKTAASSLGANVLYTLSGLGFSEHLFATTEVLFRWSMIRMFW